MSELIKAKYAFERFLDSGDPGWVEDFQKVVKELFEKALEEEAKK